MEIKKIFVDEFDHLKEKEICLENFFKPIVQEKPNFCVVVNGKAFEGSMAMLVSMLYKVSLPNGVLTASFLGLDEITYHSYSSEFTTEERTKDIVDFLFRKIPSFGANVYKKHDS